MSLTYIAYISTSKKLMDETELIDILKVAQKNNEAAKVTGILLYSQGTFMQVLEGELTEVKRIYNIIEKDPRHKNLIQLIEGDLKTRNFPNWSMGFSSINAEKFDEVKGYFNPTKNFLDDKDSKQSSIIMLKAFSDANKIHLGY